MPKHRLDHARESWITVEECPTWQDAVNQSDILYMTRLQEERFPDALEFSHIKATYQVNADMLANARPHLRILHPLPRVNEIAIDVDRTPHAHYFAQAGNGIPVRQALLSLVLGVQ